jgi:hypothetical protein
MGAFLQTFAFFVQRIGDGVIQGLNELDTFRAFLAGRGLGNFFAKLDDVQIITVHALRVDFGVRFLAFASEQHLLNIVFSHLCSLNLMFEYNTLYEPI